MTKQMNPDVNLQEQDWILTLTRAKTRSNRAVRRLRELRDALNGWLQSGGVEPEWSKAPRAAKYFSRSKTA
jgi:hypothetical protein